jgi:hypothetical protein
MPFGEFAFGLMWSLTWSNCSWVTPGSVILIPMVVCTPRWMSGDRTAVRQHDVPAGVDSRDTLGAL